MGPGHAVVSVQQCARRPVLSHLHASVSSSMLMVPLPSLSNCLKACKGKTAFAQHNSSCKSAQQSEQETAPVSQC